MRSPESGVQGDRRKEEFFYIVKVHLSKLSAFFDAVRSYEIKLCDATTGARSSIYADNKVG